MDPKEHLIKVERTARFLTLGIPGPHIKRVWYVLHGYGQLASYFIKHFEIILDEETLVIAPEGLSLFYIPPGWTRVGATWMTREKRVSEITDYVNYLNAVAAQVQNLAPADAQINILGFSQGATTAWRWVEMGGVPVKNFVNWAGAIPDEYLEMECQRMNAANLFYVRASDDEYIKPAASQATIENLRKLNPNLRVMHFEGNHRMDAITLRNLAEEIRSVTESNLI